MMNISLGGWISRIKDLFYDLEKTINTIREDYKADIFDELQENKQSAGIRAIGFMEDMNNIFVGLKEAKTDEEKLKWANNIKELLCIDELQYIKSDRTLLKRTEGEQQ